MEKHMSGPLLSLPRDVPWKLLAVSPDMMDIEFCNRTFPYRWRSSLAVSAFEPSAEDLPEDMCEQRLTYLRVTSNITGYQPSEEETKEIWELFPDVPTEELTRIIGEYFACYGVVLNVGVFPGPNADEVETRQRISVQFLGDTVGTALDNPIERSGAVFSQPGEDTLMVVDLFPPGGDGSAELSLRNELVVTIPPTDRVEATVFHSAAPVTMEAFAAGAFIGGQESGEEQGQIHQLAVSGEGIDRVVFQAPRDEASLLEFAYFGTSTRPAELFDYPHIIDFEPKTRDLYQAATETGELLTASVSKVATDKTLTHTETSETGLSLSSTYESPETPYGKGSVTGSWSHKWGDTNVDARVVGVDTSRDRRETQGTSTNISQLYNLLTGYHVGTNRAVFLMLPRPHILQPTDRRTFIQGLRVIEGVQEYFLIVTRPAYVEGMSIEVTLETGHFPEDVEVEEPPDEYEETSEEFEVTAYARGGHGWSGRGDTVDITSDLSSTYNVAAGTVVDKRPGKGDPGHPGVSEIANNSDSEANDSLRSYNYQATDSTVQVSGRISGNDWWGSGANFRRTYRVFTRSEQPIDSDAEPVVVTPFLITGRGLCVRYRSEGNCPIVIPLPTHPDDLLPGDWVVDEEPLRVASLSSRSAPGQRFPLIKEALRQIQFAMARSGRMPSRRPFGAVRFLDSDYFAGQIAKHLPPDLARRPVSEVRMETGEVAEGSEFTVYDLMTTDFATLQRLTGLPIHELAQLRRASIRLRRQADQAVTAPRGDADASDR
jgi:hypothetical protein